MVLVGLISYPGSAIAHSKNCPAISSSDNSQAWSDYQVIIWQDQTPARLAGLARLGVTAGRIFGFRSGLNVAEVPQEVAPFRALNLRFYVENIGTDFYAVYHRWQPARSVTWLFDQIKNLHRHDPADITAFIRTPSLSDQNWMRRITQRLKQHVWAFKTYRPLYYSLADEAGIADLAAAWDFDYSPASITAMRAWLKHRYGSLMALNRQWGSHFSRWNAVMPRGTDAALRQSGENYSAWGDFKAWMDVAFARAVRAGTDAVHAANPRARAALEGAQPPGWGGYNYSRLATAVDVLELYDADNNVEIVRSLAPSVVTLSTTSLASPEQTHEIWHGLLMGERGMVLWDPENAFVNDDGNPTQRGKALATLVSGLRSGIAAQLITSRPATSRVAILYSPASFRTQWLLDRKADARPWANRGSEAEDIDENPVRVATRAAARLLTHLGVQPRWVTRVMIEKGMLKASRIRMLVLPHAIALSADEVRIIRNFARDGGVVLTDVAPGLFDAHSRRRERPPLADLASPNGSIILIPEMWKDVQPREPMPLEVVRQILAKEGVAPSFSLSAPERVLTTNIDTRVFRNGDTTIIGLQRDRRVGVNNAKQKVTLGFNTSVYAYDLRQPSPPQHAHNITLTLDPIEPAIIAVTRKPLPKLKIIAPRQARLGGAAYITVQRPRTTLSSTRTAHLEVIAPGGKVVSAGNVNLSAHRSCVTWRVPLKLTDPVGDWTIRMVDVLGSMQRKKQMTVRPP